MENVWILVADAAHGRMFTTPDARMISEVADYAHPESRQHERDLTTDEPGRSFDSGGQGRHAMEPKQAAHDHEADAFAGELADALDKGRNEHRYDHLVLIAPPEFLGRLRGRLSKPTAQSVVAEIDKNLVHLDAQELLPYVKERIDL